MKFILLGYMFYQRWQLERGNNQIVYTMLLPIYQNIFLGLFLFLLSMSIITLLLDITKSWMSVLLHSITVFPSVAPSILYHNPKDEPSFCLFILRDILASPLVFHCLSGCVNSQSHGCPGPPWVFTHLFVGPSEFPCCALAPAVWYPSIQLCQCFSYPLFHSW